MEKIFVRQLGTSPAKNMSAGLKFQSKEKQIQLLNNNCTLHEENRKINDTYLTVNVTIF